jgi:hypothetical protein
MNRSRLVGLLAALLTACSPAVGDVGSPSIPPGIPEQWVIESDEVAALQSEPPSSAADPSAEAAASAVGDPESSVTEGPGSGGSGPDVPPRVGRPLGTPLPPATTVPVIEDVPDPVSIRLPSIGMSGAEVVPVGVTFDGEYEVPPATQVGWYKFGPEPGRSGSAVLAAHIASGGVDGVFRYLSRLEPGDTFETVDSSLTETQWVVIEMAQYLKDQLPTDLIFSSQGPPRLVLITCGGAFNRQLSSYESNVVAYAIPTASLNFGA